MLLFFKKGSSSMNETPRPTHKDWQAIIEEQQKSGLTQKEFCKRKNISLVWFGYYMQRSRKKPNHTLLENSASFAEVLINKPASSEIKIELPNGFKCTIPSMVQTEQLKKILSALLSC
jgi:transcriptional regulator with XRE-family HTH domain